MSDVEISSTHLKFDRVGQSQNLVIRNRRHTSLNLAFRLYQSQNYEIAPSTLQLKPGESSEVRITLKRQEGSEDFLYLVGEQLDVRIGISLEPSDSKAQRTQSSPGFQNSFEQHLDTFGNQPRSDEFIQEENRILQQRVQYLTQQNSLLNEALEQFMNQEMDQGNLQQLLNQMMDQERQENEFRSQRVLLMIEEKDKEIQYLKSEMFSSTQKQLKDLMVQNEKLQMELRECQARESYWNSHQQDKEGYLALYRKYESLSEKYRKMEALKNSLNDELLLMAQRLDESGNLAHSRISQTESGDQLVNRLNARITQLKLREEKLLEENARLEDLVNERQSAPQKRSYINVSDDLYSRESAILERSKRELEKQVKELSIQNGLLESRLDELTKENGLVSEELWKQQRDNEKLKADVRKLKEQDFSKERLELESQIFALEQALKQTSSISEVKDQARMRWERELQNLKQNQAAELQAYDKEIQGLKKLIENFKQENQLLVQQQREWQQRDKEKSHSSLEQIQELELRNQKLNKVNQQNGVDIEKTKTELLVLRDQTEQELRRRDNLEKMLNDKVVCLQDQINNIMREKSQNQTELQVEMNKLCNQHKQTVNQLLDDNKRLEQQCLQQQDELHQLRQQFSQREDQLIKEVRNMQDRIESVMNQTKQKRGDKKGEKEKQRTQSLGVNVETLEEERRRSDMYIQKIRSLEDELNKTRQQKMTLDYDLQQLRRKASLLPVAQSSEKVDLGLELEELKTTLRDLRLEREKVFEQLQQKDEEIHQLDDQLAEFQQLVQSQQCSLDKADQRIVQLNDELRRTIESKNNEISKFRMEAELKDEQNQIYQEQTKQLQNERREINERCYVQGFELEQIKQNHLDIENQRKLQIQELKAKLELVIRDHQENTDLIAKLNEQLVNSKEVYEETIKRQRNIIDLMREKFQADVQDLITRQNQYFNQNEAIKKSLTPNKETQIFQLIQQYSDNVAVLAQGQAKKLQGQEHNKQLQQTINSQKQLTKELNEKINQLQNENQELQKKVEKFKPKIPGTQKKTMTAGVPKQQECTLKQDQVCTLLLQEGRLADAEAQCSHLRAQLLLNETIIDQLTNVNIAYEQEIKKIQLSYQQIQDSIKMKDQQLIELQQKHKQDQQKMLNDLNQVQNKFVPEDKLAALQEVVQQRENTIRELRDELVRKKDVADQFRSDRDEKHSQLERIKKQFDEISAENDKLRAKQKDTDRKDSNFKDFRDKYDQLKQSEKQQQEEIKSLNERIKQLKSDISRKEQALKEMKEKFEQIQNIKPNDQEKQDLIVAAKKMREELNRKDQTLKHYKQKFDDKQAELDGFKSDFTLKYAQTVQELEKELRKNEQTKISQKKMENQVSMLVFLLKRIYRENYMELHKIKKEPVKPKNVSKFSESMNILNLGPDDLDEFLEPNISVSTVKKHPNNRDLDKFDLELSNLEQLDVNSIFNMINQVIVERVNS